MCAKFHDNVTFHHFTITNLVKHKYSHNIPSRNFFQSQIYKYSKLKLENAKSVQYHVVFDCKNCKNCQNKNARISGTTSSVLRFLHILVDLTHLYIFAKFGGVHIISFGEKFARQKLKPTLDSTLYFLYVYEICVCLKQKSRRLKCLFY